MRAVVWILCLAPVLLAPAPAEAQIYKTVDEDGNVVYTDEPPTPDAKPIQLEPLNTVESHKVPESIKGGGEREEQEQTASGAAYGGFRVISPQPDENFWGTGRKLPTELSLGRELGANHSVVYYIDGEPRTQGRSLALNIPNIDRGSHSFRAAIVDAEGEVLASAGPVTFHMHQHSRLHPNPGASGGPNAGSGGQQQGGGQGG